MIDENILWARIISPTTGRIERQHTFLASALIVIGGALIASGAGYVLYVAFAALQFSSK